MGQWACLMSSRPLGLTSKEQQMLFHYDLPAASQLHLSIIVTLLSAELESNALLNCDILLVAGLL